MGYYYYELIDRLKIVFLLSSSSDPSSLLSLSLNFPEYETEPCSVEVKVPISFKVKCNSLASHRTASYTINWKMGGNT